jgi:hypothetical protein
MTGLLEEEGILRDFVAWIDFLLGWVALRKLKREARG